MACRRSRARDASELRHVITNQANDVEMSVCRSNFVARDKCVLPPPFACDYYSPLRPEELAWAATLAPDRLSCVSRSRSRFRRPLPESARPARRSSVPAWVWPKKKYVRHIRDRSLHTEIDSRRENARAFMSEVSTDSSRPVTSINEIADPRIAQKDIQHAALKFT